ncbi:hypothetical protein GIB67_003293, partial [Kingdonia uniflora]
FIGFPLGHLRNAHHEIIHRFGSNHLQNELRNKQTEPKSFKRVMRSFERPFNNPLEFWPKSYFRSNDFNGNSVVRTTFPVLSRIPNYLGSRCLVM